MRLISMGIDAIERGWVPDTLTRTAIRRLCRQRLIRTEAEIRQADPRRKAFVDSLRNGPIAPVPEKANAQHYELPPEFFAEVLGPRRKYSCCYYDRPGMSLAEAEESALAQTCDHAELMDGQTVLELGCGWGSLTLWMAERYPASRITAVSNSVPQRLHIQAEAARRGLSNVNVVTADMNDFEAESGHFDRVVSVEMFEHMRNYNRLTEKVARWLKPNGKAFVHIFCHRNFTYPFETEGAADWMGRHFFTGGIMPATDLLNQFDRHLKVVRKFDWNGQHYQKTAEDWLVNLDRRKDAVREILANVAGREEADRALNRWRVFFLAVAELFGYDSGEEWFVSHYLLERTCV
ncbi:methyltransferase domain-containing protein [bacterium]|nr:methyltransferase domain-containing protein [bacterium]